MRKDDLTGDEPSLGRSQLPGEVRSLP